MKLTDQFSLLSLSSYLCLLVVIVSCNKQPNIIIDHPIILKEEPFIIEHHLNGSSWKELFVELYSYDRYATLSLQYGEDLLIDHLDIPDTGFYSFKVLVDFPDSKNKELKLFRTGGNLKIESLSFTSAEVKVYPIFQDISKVSGLNTRLTWKYGGPSIADVDKDGDYDFILNNHDKVPAQLFWNQGGSKLSEHEAPLMRWDIHGSAAGDYDRDGDLDIVIAQGGGNGTNPQPPHLLQNENGHFKRISDEVGITEGARGRSVRWIDMDLDGDLDLLFINAQGLNTVDGKIHMAYENMGDGTFQIRNEVGIETVLAERILVTDINNDFINDLILFEPLSIWLGNGDFTYTEVSNRVLPTKLQGIDNITAVAPIDLENDGDLDLYLSRGKTYYQMANKSLDFNPQTKRVDIRDEGNKGKTSIEFDAEGDIALSGLFLWYRLYDGGFPLYLGNKKTIKDFNEGDSITIQTSMASGWPENTTKNGWYLGHLGNDRWRLEWVRNDNIYWGIRISIDGVDCVFSDWKPQNRNVQDVLLLNEGDKFKEVTNVWNIPKGGNHQGVTVGDFNNDGFEDLYVYRFGFLRSRVTDWLLINNGRGAFEITNCHGVGDPKDPGHGDMGQAFDFDLDGQVDLLSGRDNPGKWYLHKNQGLNDNNYLLVQVGYSPKKEVDPIGAVVSIETDIQSFTKRVGSAGAVHSQSLLNIVHFGLGKMNNIQRIKVRWRNGEQVVIEKPTVNQIYKAGD
ncbi:MAG: CRTAC1 family protein [Bacteroidota bacterium]